LILSRLYLITPERLDLAGFADSLSAALDAGEVAAVQLRLKNYDDKFIRHAVSILRPIVQNRNAAFILNDRADLAAETGCDGVHIGQQDVSYAEAREAVGPDSIVGVTCHDSRHLAIEAAEQGADYVAFGAFFPTQTKIASGHPTPDILEWWTEVMVVPSVAIGGITPENVVQVIAADFIAVCSGIWNHPQGPAAAVKAYLSAIEQAGS
jgi:thiamine-phosphate pyrophosphorylase